MAASAGVRVLRNGPVTTIVMHRPAARNAVNRDQARALAEAFVAFDKDEAASVAVLYGDGGVFCAGADLKSFDNDLSDDMDELGPMGISRLRLSKPVVAAIEGHAVAGGLELACWCDLRVADETAIFGVFCRRFGVPLIDGGTVRLPRLIGQSRAMDMILTGRPVDAEEAFHIGLLNRLVSKGEVLSAAQQLAAQIAAMPQVCLRSDRQSALEQWSLSERDALANEFRHGLRTLASGESVDGAKRFQSGQGRGGAFPKPLL